MNSLFKAIQDHFKLDTDDPFYVALNGKLWLNVVRQEWPFPYSVYQSVGDSTDYDSTDTREDFTIQFTVFSESNSNTEAGTLIELLKDMFDGAKLTVDGWSVIEWTRINPARPLNDFQQTPPIQGYYVEYDVVLEKQRDNCN